MATEYQINTVFSYTLMDNMDLRSYLETYCPANPRNSRVFKYQCIRLYCRNTEMSNYNLLTTPVFYFCYLHPSITNIYIYVDFFLRLVGLEIKTNCQQILPDFYSPNLIVNKLFNAVYSLQPTRLSLKYSFAQYINDQLDSTYDDMEPIR